MASCLGGMPVPNRFTSGLSFVFALLALFASHQARALNVEVENFTLKNGMQVVVIPDHRAPVVTQMVWYKVGAADEPPGEAGVAHFLEHLMFKGTDILGPGEFSKVIKKNGGNDNAFTSQDYTAYFQSIAKDRLELAMRLEANRMQNLNLSDEVVLPERDVILEERRMRVDNNPASKLGEQIDAALYVSHPYGNPVIGWMPQVSALTRENAVRFYRTYYTPSNAILIVAGDVTAKDVRPLAEKYYGALENTATPPQRIRSQEPEPVAARRLSLTDPRVAAPTWQRTYLAPSYQSAKATGQAEALDILAQILGGSTNSRLYQGFVIEQKIATQAGSYYSGGLKDYGNFGFYAVPANGTDMASLEAAMDKAIADIQEKGVSEEELARAKNTMIAQATYALDSPSSLARLFGQSLAIGGSIEDVTGWSDRIAKVSAAQVQEAARSILDIRASVTATLLPEKANSSSAEAAPLMQAPVPEQN